MAKYIDPEIKIIEGFGSIICTSPGDDTQGGGSGSNDLVDPNHETLL